MIADDRSLKGCWYYVNHFWSEIGKIVIEHSSIPKCFENR